MFELAFLKEVIAKRVSKSSTKSKENLYDSNKGALWLGKNPFLAWFLKDS